MASKTMRRIHVTAKRKASRKARFTGLPAAVRSDLVRILERRASVRWGHLAVQLVVRFRGRYAFVGHVDPHTKSTPEDSGTEDVRPLFRLEYTGDPRRWHFALFTYSTMRYSPCINDAGTFTEGPERAFDRAAGLYLG